MTTSSAAVDPWVSATSDEILEPKPTKGDLADSGEILRPSYNMRWKRCIGESQGEWQRMRGMEEMPGVGHHSPFFQTRLTTVCRICLPAVQEYPNKLLLLRTHTIRPWADETLIRCRVQRYPHRGNSLGEISDSILLQPLLSRIPR